MEGSSDFVHITSAQFSERSNGERANKEEKSQLPHVEVEEQSGVTLIIQIFSPILLPAKFGRWKLCFYSVKKIQFGDLNVLETSGKANLRNSETVPVVKFKV